MLFDYIINISYLVASSSWFNMIMSMDTKTSLAIMFSLSLTREGTITEY